MPQIVVRKGYRCLPGSDVSCSPPCSAWTPRHGGRLAPRTLPFVETRAPGEPDLEVEFTFDSYGEMEQIERRLREHLGRVARDVGSAGQELLLEPSATRYLLLLDEPAARPAADPARPGLGGGRTRPAPVRRPAAQTEPPWRRDFRLQSPQRPWVA